MPRNHSEIDQVIKKGPKGQKQLLCTSHSLTPAWLQFRSVRMKTRFRWPRSQQGCEEADEAFLYWGEGSQHNRIKIGLQ
jgi:hypothetical protein